MTTVVGSIGVRDVTAADEPFLRVVYESSRALELAGLSWREDERAAFMDQQFGAQAVDHRRRFPDARFLVVELGGAPIGRLSIADRGETVHILDIALLPEHRGAGVGEALLYWVIGEGRGVSLSVGKWNPAQRLYRRLGFEPVADDGAYLEMERPPLN